MKPIPQRKKRAKAGQGRQNLTGQARAIASAKHHNLGYFTKTATGFEARCQDCFAMVIIEPSRVPIDGGIGGSATKKPCQKELSL